MHHRNVTEKSRIIAFARDSNAGNRHRNTAIVRKITTKQPIRLTYCYHCFRASLPFDDNAVVAVPTADSDPRDTGRSMVPVNTSHLKSQAEWILM